MKKILILCSLPFFLFGASGGNDYDIVPRTINFIIFAAILYYLIANPVKSFFKNRILGISARLDDIQNKLSQSKAKKLEAMKKLEEAKSNAASAIANAKKEAEIIALKIEQESKEELQFLEHQFEDQKIYELRKMEREVVNQILNELFANTKVEQNQILNIMLKKVS